MNFKVENINIKDSTIFYDYTFDNKIKKYFNSKNKFFVKYDQDITTVPESILIIPLLANLMPIAWFAGFDVYVDSADSAFVDSLKKIKAQFEKDFPGIKMKKSNLHVNNLENNLILEGGKSAMLFSGGVDAYTTFFRHYESLPDLITIKGADIKLGDINEWKNLKQYISEQKVLKNNSKFFIESNLRDFYTFEVDKLLENLGWWGKIQHGLSLTSICAPLAFLRNYHTIYIASSYTRKANYETIVWGSMPEIDNEIKWSKTYVKHDGEELTRQQKISFIKECSTIVGIYPKLRVCYNEFKDGLNCNHCEKCQRTIFALMINNANPDDFGFNVDVRIFDLLLKTMSNPFSTKGNQLFWKEIYEQALTSGNYYNQNLSQWSKGYQEFLPFLKDNLDRDILSVSKMRKYKYDLISKFPILFKYYLKIRRKFL